MIGDQKYAANTLYRFAGKGFEQINKIYPNNVDFVWTILNMDDSVVSNENIFTVNFYVLKFVETKVPILHHHGYFLVRLGLQETKILIIGSERPCNMFWCLDC